MAVKRGGLGKGLDSLIPDMNVGSAAAPKTEVKTKIVEKVVEKVVEVEKPVEVKVKVTKIEPNKEQPRKNFD
jgi:ParB family chromosome partitioning protein